MSDSSFQGEAVAVSGTSGNTETEVKIRLQSPEAAIERLSASGFVVSKPRVFEANTVFDTPEESLRATGRLLRLREVASQAIVTFKGPADVGKHKSREELETSMGDALTAASIFERLGFAARFRYEKYRTEYERPAQHGVVTVDETPVGWFMELEGTSEWIDRTAAELGYSESEYLTDSYGALYLQHCEKTGLTPTHMVFPTTC
jgi:adenylate cyclase, class 2